MSSSLVVIKLLLINSIRKFCRLRRVSPSFLLRFDRITENIRSGRESCSLSTTMLEAEEIPWTDSNFDPSRGSKETLLAFNNSKNCITRLLLNPLLCWGKFHFYFSF